MSDFVKCASTTDFADNENKAIEVEGQSILICNTKEGFLRLRICARTSCNRLRAGAFGGVLSFCPLHGQRFNLKDGAPIGSLTDKPLRCFELAIEGEDILVKL